ncbi:radical SAM/SPASM domain-containing protein [Synechococcus sp. UW105]|uniref:radical SAM/SPASM domain-containing protein n=1 Tax=Synechococcus sp. UW105 TaxID=337067 RepID=UPI000E0F8ACC|nr:radical SAM protein [Synechococcus sp. UW105]
MTAKLKTQKKNFPAEGKIPYPSKVFAIPAGSSWLIHAPLHNFNALLTEEDIQEIRSNKVNMQDTELAIINQLIQQEPHLKPKQKQGELSDEFLVFVTTRGCNLQCTYCHFDGPTSPQNSLDIQRAKEIIKWTAKRRSQRQQKTKEEQPLRIHFFGGEPFTTFELIKEIVEFTNKECLKNCIQPFYMATTNGVLSESMRVWISENFHKIILSIDGEQDEHDRHRPINKDHGSYQAVARSADYFSKSKLELHIRGCITSETVHNMKSIASNMVKRWQPASIKFEPLTENTLTILASLYPPNPTDFAKNWYHTFLHLRGTGVDFAYTPINPGEPRLTSCLVGDDAIVVHPDGSLNACYLSPSDWEKHEMNLKIGEVNANGKISIEQSNINEIRELVAKKDKCEDCFCRYSCAGGCHVTHTHKGAEYKYDDFCIGTRLITASLLLEAIGRPDLISSILDDNYYTDRIPKGTQGDKLTTIIR